MEKLLKVFRAILNSYAVLFFLQNRVLGAFLIAATFFNPAAGVSALTCVVISILLTAVTGYDLQNIKTGIYSFNALLLGLAFGSFYNVNFSYVLWLVTACIIVIILTIVFSQHLAKLGLPILSFPFIITFWLVMLAANSIYNIGLQPHTDSLIAEIYNGQSNIRDLHQYLLINLPNSLLLFFRSLSAILFQNNVIVGMIISIGILIHSRIAFSLLVIGFITTCAFNKLFNIYIGGVSYYHLGANFMMTCVAIGSFFTIASWRSYVWALVSIPINFVLISAFSNLLAVHYLPIFSLPFCLVNFSILYFFLQRKTESKLHLAALQHYSPERNLYQFINLRSRLNNLKYFNISLPFMGSWAVSQGYNGSITHKGDWAQALDFVIEDTDKKTYQLPGTLPEHFYCYNKPVLACGDGIVETIVNDIEDNTIGQINEQDNWGNTIVIKHWDGMYSKVSHLKKGSIKVNVGDMVKQGDHLALCGNSGRSPEPHLHFQMQCTPYVGSKTLVYPFSSYQKEVSGINTIHTFDTPNEGDVISSLLINTSLKKAFAFETGYRVKLTLTQESSEEILEVYTDELGQSYFHSKTTAATAYFIKNNTGFYFTSFYGDDTSSLYLLFLSAFKVSFAESENLITKDDFPLQLTGNKVALWLQDLVAPFTRFIKLTYQNQIEQTGKAIKIESRQTTSILGNSKTTMQARINISNNTIISFTTTLKDKSTTVAWNTESI